MRIAFFIAAIILMPFTFVYSERNSDHDIFREHDNWYHYRKGMEQIKAKNYPQAKKEFNYYLEHPELHRRLFGVAYFGLGLLYQTLGKNEQAIIEYKLAIQNDLHPTVIIKDRAYMNIGTIYMGEKAYKEANEAYLKAVEGNPENGLAHYYLGLSYLRTGELEKAEIESQKAKKLGVTFTALSDELSKIKNNNTDNTTKTDKAN